MSIPLIHLKRIDSTQDFLERHAELGYCGVLADCQLFGRGQRDNRWESACDSGLWLSAALPVTSLISGMVLQKAMSAVAAILELHGMPLGIKWPNDLVAWKSGRLVKLGGVIGKVKYNRMILGVGLNIWSAPIITDRTIPPACLKEIYPNITSLPTTLKLARMILNAWENLTDQWEPSFYWPKIGDLIRYDEGEGICEGWLSDGRLAVRNMSGHLIHLSTSTK